MQLSQPNVAGVCSGDAVEDAEKLPPVLYANHTPLSDRDAVARLLCAVAVLEERRIQGEAARHARKDAEPDSWVQLVELSSNLFAARNEQTGQVVELRPKTEAQGSQETQETPWKTIGTWRNGSTVVKLKGKVDGKTATFTGPNGSSVTFEVVDAEGRPTCMRVTWITAGLLRAQQNISVLSSVEAYFRSGSLFPKSDASWDEIDEKVIQRDDIDNGFHQGDDTRRFSWQGDMQSEGKLLLSDKGREEGEKAIVGLPVKLVSLREFLIEKATQLQLKQPTSKAAGAKNAFEKRVKRLAIEPIKKTGKAHQFNWLQLEEAWPNLGDNLFPER